MTAPDWSAMLAGEEARAMAGKPAFRVRMACVAGVACPRCGAPVEARCVRPKAQGTRGIKGSANPAPLCRERVWAMRALQRSPAMSRPPRVADVAGFMDAIAGADLTFGIYMDGGMWRAAGQPLFADDSDLDPAIRHGLVRLSVAASGAPVWVITEAGAEYAAGWRKTPA